MTEKKIIMAGFGGQGIMLMGQLVTHAGMHENKNVSWLPSYGPEMRGGAANCSVIVSDKLVGAPNVTIADDIIVMNEPSLDRFEDSIKNGGNLFINSSLISREVKRDDVNIYEVPVNELASELKNKRVSNMIMLGAFIEVTKTVEVDSILEGFKTIYGNRAEKLLPMNIEAMEIGSNYIKENYK